MIFVCFGITHIWQVIERGDGDIGSVNISFDFLPAMCVPTALPYMQNFLESREFSSPQAGRWYLMLFPNGETSAKDIVGSSGGTNNG